MALDSDINNADAQLHVEFYTKDDGANQGKPYVRIMAPGDKTNIIDQPMRDDHKERFPRQWLYYQMQQNEGAAQQIGTPLTQWQKDYPEDINRDQIAEAVVASNARAMLATLICALECLMCWSALTCCAKGWIFPKYHWWRSWMQIKRAFCAQSAH